MLYKKQNNEKEGSEFYKSDKILDEYTYIFDQRLVQQLIYRLINRLDTQVIHTFIVAFRAF